VSKTSYISILCFNEHLITHLRVKPSPAGIEVVSFENQSINSSDALKAFADTHQIRHDSVYTVIPRHEMTARILELPSQDLAEVANMVRFSADEYMPYPVEELVINQQILALLPDGQARVLAIFAHRDVIGAHLDHLSQAEIEPAQIFLSTTCLASVAATAPQPGSYALVHLASGGLEIIIMNGSSLEYNRAVGLSLDWNDTDNLTDLVNELAVEIRATLSSYRHETNALTDIDCVLISSDVTNPAVFAEALIEQTGMDCRPAAWPDSMFTAGHNRSDAMPMVSLGGALLASGGGKYRIELLPEANVQARKIKALKKGGLRCAAMAGIIVVAIMALYLQSVHQRLAHISTLRNRIAQVEPRAEGIMEKQKQLKMLQQQVDTSGSIIELLAALCQVYPEAGLNITQFSFTRNQELIVRGRAQTRNHLQKLSQDLIDLGKTAIPQFARAQRSYETETTEHGAKVWEYTIEMPLGLSGEPTEHEETPGHE